MNHAGWTKEDRVRVIVFCLSEHGPLALEGAATDPAGRLGNDPPPEKILARSLTLLKGVSGPWTETV